MDNEERWKDISGQLGEIALNMDYIKDSMKVMHQRVDLQETIEKSNIWITNNRRSFIITSILSGTSGISGVVLMLLKCFTDLSYPIDIPIWLLSFAGVYFIFYRVSVMVNNYIVAKSLKERNAEPRT